MIKINIDKNDNLFQIFIVQRTQKSTFWSLNFSFLFFFLHLVPYDFEFFIYILKNKRENDQRKLS
jgi:hypothetical protein